MGTWNVKLLAAAVLVAGGLTAGFGGAFSAHAQDAPKEKTKEVKDDRDKVIEDLKRQLEAQEKQALAARDAAKQRALAERQRALAVQAELDAIAKREAQAKKPQSEFKYYGQSADFAPTPDELEALVQRGEAGGYKFVGISNMKGTGKGDGVVPTLVFRRAKVVDLRLDGVLEELPLKKLEGLELDLNKMKQGLKLDLNGLELKKNLMLDDVKKMAEAKAKEAEAKAKEAELKAKEKVKEKLDAEWKEKVKEKGPLPKRPADAADEKAKYQAEIDALRAAIAELEGKTAKKPVTKTVAEVTFTPDEFGKTGLKNAGTLLSALATAKYGDDPKGKVNVTVSPDKVVVSGDPEVVKWLQEAVKQLRAPAAEKKAK
jgi:hypothetical protein